MKLLAFCFKGFILYVNRLSDNLFEERIDFNQRSYLIKNLNCGTVYQISIRALSPIGKSEKSEFIDVSTNGTGNLTLTFIYNIFNCFLTTFFLKQCPLHRIKILLLTLLTQLASISILKHGKTADVR